MTDVRTPPTEGLQPGDIQYPYADPVMHDGQTVAPPGPDYVPPVHDVTEPEAEAEEAPAPEPEPAEPQPDS